MIDAGAIVADPAWLPHEIDATGQRVRFVRFGPGQLQGRAFLADIQQGEAELWVPIPEVVAMQPQIGPVHFIFHSGFCRSTLLLQALAIPGRATSLNEPGVLNSLASIELPDQQLADALVRLLARPHHGSASVIIKPSNYPNRLIPQLMRSVPHARAIIITNDLRSFLQAVVRKGMPGRQWGRQVCLTSRSYAAGSGGFDLATLAGLTDLQLAGLGWLYLQSWFADRLAASEGRRIKVIDSAFFNSNRAATISAASDHFGLEYDEETIAGIVDGAVFRSHSKLGVDYTERERMDRERSQSPVTEEEIGLVLGWIGEIARASGLTAPVTQTLA